MLTEIALFLTLIGSSAQKDPCDLLDRATVVALLGVSQVTFSSSAEASRATTKELVTARMDGDGAKVTEELGLSDRAFWTYTLEGAQYVVLKGSVVRGVALGGQLAKPPVSYRKELRAATVVALGKM